MENSDIASPSQDRTKRYMKDQQIRARGYTIASRPTKGQPTWMKNGVEFAHDHVLLREKL
jgi:hypothetical protein